MLFTVLLGLGFLGLAGVLVHIHVRCHEHYKEVADQHTLRMFLREPRRGEILDVQGHPLATSFPVKRLFADPSLLGPYYAEVARAVAPLVDYQEGELIQKLRPTLRTNANGRLVTNSFVNLRRKLDADQWQQVTQTLASLRFPIESARLKRSQRDFFTNLRQQSFYGVDDYRREYPSGKLAAHVLGCTQEKESEVAGRAVTTTVTELKGIDGIENWLDPKLRGVRGWVLTETDRRKREVVMHRGQSIDPRPGLNVVLTIDMVVQNILETELAEAMKTYAPESAVGIITRPRTGEIVALAVLPNYDPNNLGTNTALRRNRAITDRIEPGSTFKIVVVASALHEKLVTLDDHFFCENGHWMYLGRPLRDHGSYGDMSVLAIITKSSNIGAAKIGLQLGEEKLYQYVRAFGFGQPTGITLPGEVGGLLPSPKLWDRITITRIPMGHSVDVTPIQMVMAMSAIANDGIMMKPLLVKSLQDADGKTVTQFSTGPGTRIISSQAAKDTVTALKTVPTREGTAIKAALDFYTVAGKTGTAQIPDGNRGYLDGVYVSSFCGFFPADNPELCLYIMLNKVDRAKGGYYGGQVAAPIFKRVAEQAAQHLKIRPDKEGSYQDALATSTNGTTPPLVRTP